MKPVNSRNEIAIVKALLHYNPDSGALIWRHRSREWFKSDRSMAIWNTRFAGSLAGNIRTRKDGYTCVAVRLLGRNRLAHRLIWMWMTGELPPDCIDHRNRNATDNRWVNLRASTPANNSKNTSMRRSNKSGVTGVYWNRRAAKWHASIRVNGRDHYLGLFASLLDAAAARRSATNEYGFSKGHGLSSIQQRAQI